MPSELDERIKYVSTACIPARCKYATVDIADSGKVLNAGCYEKYPDSLEEDFQKFGFCGWGAQRIPKVNVVIPLMVMKNGVTKNYSGIERVPSDDHRRGLFRDQEGRPLFQM